MNRFFGSLAVLVLAAAPLTAADAPKDAAAPAAAPAAKPKAPKAAAAREAFKTEDDKTVYAYGYKIGQNLAPDSFSESELKAFTQGLREGVTGKSPAVSLAIYLPKVGDLEQKRVAAFHKKKGVAYAAKWAKEESALPIQGGGWYKAVTEGTGAQPKAEDTVKVHYRGTLIDGAEFDSSYKRGKPATFPLNQVIPCWTHGVAMMKVGGKAKLVCPSEVAYGDAGNPPVIPSGATLTFEVELIEIVKPDAPAGDAKPAKKN